MIIIEKVITYKNTTIIQYRSKDFIVLKPKDLIPEIKINIHWYDWYFPTFLEKKVNSALKKLFSKIEQLNSIRR